MKNVEFFTRPDGEVEVCEEGKPSFQLTENHRDFITEMLALIREEYRDAFNALCEYYKESGMNRCYFDFLVVRRFIKCNWSQYDNFEDIDRNGNLHFEFTSCPMRGECRLHKIVCEPKHNSAFSPAELNVLRLMVDDLSDTEIADKLHLSIFTVQNHRKNMMRKKGFNHAGQLINYWHNNDLK